MVPRRRGDGARRRERGKNRAKKRPRTSAGIVRVLASLVLCVAASYAGAAVTGTGLSSDDIPMGEAARPSASEDASFVMSWSWDTAGGKTEETDATGASDTDDAHAERIKELADAYIAEKSGKTGE